jgi:hypothetical protein
MLWNHAPSEAMVGGGPVNCFGGRRGDSLLRPGLARRGKNLHIGAECVLVDAPATDRGRAIGAAETPDGRTQLHRFFHYGAAHQSNILRRRCHRGAFEPCACAAAQPRHYLAFERQAVGVPAGRGFIFLAAFGSRHVRAGGDHHRSANELVPKQQYRYFLRAAALRTRTPAQIDLFRTRGSLGVR